MRTGSGTTSQRPESAATSAVESGAGVSGARRASERTEGPARYRPTFSSGPRGRPRSTASSDGTPGRLGRTIALDLNETHTISLFGVQGGGKSYTLGSVIEAATLPTPPVNELPSPLATIVFHYSQTLDYEPEFTSMIAPNSDRRQISDLAARYGGSSAGAGVTLWFSCPPISWKNGARSIPS